MRFKRMLRNLLVAATLFALLLSGCFTILSVEQPDSAMPGQQITIKLLVRTESDPGWGLINDGQYGIFGIMMPDDWNVDSVWYRSHDVPPDTSDLRPMIMEYLDPADPDNSPGGKVDYWTDSLEFHYPPPDGMWWEVYQSVEEDSTQIDTGYVDLFVKVTVGSREGSYDLAYFTTMATLDWDEEHYYSYSPGHTITVSATAIEDRATTLPGTFTLYQNYPNPFNPRTTIRYELQKAADVSLTLHDLNGRQVDLIFAGKQATGMHQINYNAEHLASGIYLYRLSDGRHSLTRKLMIIK